MSIPNNTEKVSIKKYSPKNFSDLVYCMDKLQDYIVSIDYQKLNTKSEKYAEKYTQFLLKKVENSNGIIFMAYYDDKIAGCIAGIIEKTGDEDSLGFCIEKIGIIKELFIEETYRNFGIGGSLMQKVESYFLENGINYCWVEVFAENENAYNFYKKRGYNSRMISLNKKLGTKM